MNPTPGRPFVIAIGIIVVLILIGVAVWFVPSVRSWFSMVFSQQEARSYAYLGVENGRGILYEVGVTGIEKRSYEGFSIIDYVKARDIEVAILKDSNGSYDVYQVDGGVPQQLTTDGRVKDSLDISPDGSQVVYGVEARTLPLPKGSPENSVVYQLSEWDVEHISVQTKTISLVGPGNHPRFYKEGLFYPAPTGFVYRVIDTDGFDARDTWSILPDVMAYRIIDIPVLTQEGLLVFPSVSRSSYEAVILESVSPLDLATAPNHPIAVPQGTRDITVTDANEILTITYGADRKARILNITNGESTSLFAFPSGTYPEKFINQK